MVEGTLLERLRKLEALHAGTKFAGEREAAQRAAEKIRARLAELRGREVEVEYRYSLPDPWKRKLFVALCRRYGLKPYREYGQGRNGARHCRRSLSAEGARRDGARARVRALMRGGRRARVGKHPRWRPVASADERWAASKESSTRSADGARPRDWSA